MNSSPLNGTSGDDESLSRLLALDISTSTGWALFVDGNLERSGVLPKVLIADFNVNKDPQKSPAYPYNIVTAAEKVVDQIGELINSLGPSEIVTENTNKGRNRSTQRALEFQHFAFLKRIQGGVPFSYIDTSEWRSLVGLWMTKDDKKNNKEVSAGKKRGRINKKHLAIRHVEERFGIKLKMNQNDQADAICLGEAHLKRRAA